MRPVRIHLDTSDYSSMHVASKGSEMARIREQLVAMTAGGQIEIGLSYHIVFELLQKAGPEYREDRLARARLLKELCGSNAFACGRDLGQGYVFSKDGIWMPRDALEDFEIERLVEHLVRGLSCDPRLSRAQRRSLSRRANFEAYVRHNPEALRLSPGDTWPLPIGREITENGDLRRYILRQISRQEINRKLWAELADPVKFYQTWFEYQGRANPLEEEGEKLARLLMEMFEMLQSMLTQSDTLRVDLKRALGASGADALSAEDRALLLGLKRDLRKFRAEIISPDELNKRVPVWRNIVGEKSARLAAQIMFAFQRDRPKLVRSDVIDFVHAMYLPHTDLWRGDRSFSSLLIRNKVDFCERVVPTLVELPARIDVELGKSGVHC